MRNLTFLAFILLFSIQLWGQESTNIEKITLKSGEVYIGEIVAKNSEIVMIKTSEGTRFQFQLSEIKNIENYSNLPKIDNNLKISNQDITIYDNFCGNIELSAGGSIAKNSFSLSPTTQLSMIFGNKRILKKDIFFGVGIGYSMTYVSQNSDPISFLPVFFRLQNTFTKQRTSPFIEIDAGYAFGLNADYGGGPMVNITTGISHKLSYKTNLIGGIYGGITSFSGKITETNALGTFTYSGQNSMFNFGLKITLQF
jgi:hypothetical protein